MFQIFQTTSHGWSGSEPLRRCFGIYEAAFKLSSSLHEYVIDLSNILWPAIKPEWRLGLQGD
jgi:hypothetical protein